MRLGIAVGVNWRFFKEIYADLQPRYQTSLFEPRQLNLPLFRERVNRIRLHRDLEKFLRANDVALFEWATEWLVIATQKPKHAGIITRLHRFELYQWADRVNWDAVDRIILVSQAKKEEFLSRFPSQAGKIVVSSPSVSLEKFTPGAKEFNGDIGILCDLIPRKRVYDLILAFKELIAVHPGFHLHIGGGVHEHHQDYFHAMQHLVAKCQLQDKVTFYGPVSEPWHWYHRIDIFISNSYSEGLQVAPMEAMASGCYCLSHFWAGADELLPPENLFFTDRELIAKILAYGELSETQKQDARARMRAIAQAKFNIEDTKRTFRDCIEEVWAAHTVTGALGR